MVKASINFAHSFPAFSSPSAQKSHRCIWMSPRGKKLNMEKCMSYHSIIMTLGKEAKCPQNRLTSCFPEQEENLSESCYYQNLEKISAISSPFSRQMDPYYTAPSPCNIVPSITIYYPEQAMKYVAKGDIIKHQIQSIRVCIPSQLNKYSIWLLI